MRAKEFITDSADSINTFLTMHGFSIDKFEELSANIISHFENKKISTEKMKHYLTEINFKIIEIVGNDELWSRLSDDPEVGIIYDRLAVLANNNFDYVSKRNGNGL